MRVLIADDAVLIRAGIVRLLSEQGFDVVGETGSAEDLDRLVERLDPDVVVLDIRMPPTYTDEGLVAAARLRVANPSLGILVLSQHLEPAYAIRLLRESPAHVGYLLKERLLHVHELGEALLRVASGECVVDRAMVEELLRRRRRTSQLDALTEREREILHLMAEGRSNRGISDALFLGPKTVETHIRSVFGKLGLEDSPIDNRRTLAVLTYLRK